MRLCTLKQLISTNNQKTYYIKNLFVMRMDFLLGFGLVWSKILDFGIKLSQLPKSVVAVIGSSCYFSVYVIVQFKLSSSFFENLITFIFPAFMVESIFLFTDSKISSG